MPKVYDVNTLHPAAEKPFGYISNMDMLHLYAAAIDDDDADYIQSVQEEIYMRMEG